jgi:xanthine/uracil/vitamin C permease (AzgA family)
MSHHHPHHPPHHEPTSDEMRPKDAPKSAAAKLFDLRILIGALFTFYGIVLTIYGFFTSDAEITKSAGIHINLWLGLGMLVLGLLFLLWARLSPVVHEAPPAGASARPPMH